MDLGDFSLVVRVDYRWTIERLVVCDNPFFKNYSKPKKIKSSGNKSLNNSRFI
jgi:hypothetical protein